MNRERAKQMLPIIKAWADGKVIEFLVIDTWRECEDPSFCDPPDCYRVKPDANDIKWAAEQVKDGKPVRSREWDDGVHWRAGGVYADDGEWIGLLDYSDILADDWELYEPK